MSQPFGTALILAAGTSVRFGSDKRCTPFRESTLLQHTVDIYTNVFRRVLLVLQRGDEPLVSDLPHDVEPVFAPQATDGMSQSLRAGVQQAIQEPWLVIGLSDMPYVTLNTLKLLAHQMETTTSSIVRLRHSQQFGNPVGFKQECFSRLCALTGDEGARALLSSGAVPVDVLDVDDPGILVDIDTPAQLLTLEKSSQPLN